jgi:multidrug efflux pump subunit AcrA (membrane-fusion protein)
VEATGFPGSEAPAVMEPFVAVPKDGAYAAVFAVTPEAGGPRLLAGMTGTVRCVVYSRPDAVMLPAGAVFREADGTRVVYVDGKEGRTEKRPVKAGRTNGGRTEILEGIAAGERVRTKKP